MKYIVKDNGRKIRKAARRLVWFERACFVYTVQLAISDAGTCTPANNLLCKMARSIVENYKHNPNAKKRLDDPQTQLNKDVLHVFIDVHTNWNSQYFTLLRLLELKYSSISTLPVWTLPYMTSALPSRDIQLSMWRHLCSCLMQL